MRVLIPLLLGVSWMDPNWLLAQFGSAFFWISVLMVFVECGLLFPFLPGDTLLFAMGLFISGSKINVFPGNQAVELIVAMLVLAVGAILGNVAGYEIGHLAGPRLFHHDGRILKREYLDRTQAFFDKHGSKALVIGRFVPFVRTYVTVIAGVAAMRRRRFLVWSGLGAVLWVAVVTMLGYFLGAAFPSLGNNIDKAILVLLAFSVVPLIWEWWQHRRRSSAPDSAAERSDVDV